MVLEAALGWLIGKVLDKILGGVFSKRKQNEQIIVALTQRLEEKERHLERITDQKEGLARSLTTAKKQHEKERGHIIESLKRRGVSTTRLIEKYNKPLNAILLSYATQREAATNGRYRESHFVREELQRFNARYLGSGTMVVPPARVPKWVKSKKDLQIWFEGEILKGRYCKLKFLLLVDLKRSAFWNNYVPYTQKKPWHYSIGEVLEIEDVFTEEEISRIALSDIIRDGDIAWSASAVLSEDELAGIVRSQSIIEQQMGNPSLRVLASGTMTGRLSEVLTKFVRNPDEVAQAIVNEAKFWDARLK